MESELLGTPRKARKFSLEEFFRFSLEIERNLPDFRKFLGSADLI
jgi:hypothetical protein